MNQFKRIKAALSKSIKLVCQSPHEYCLNPEKDFTERKKLPMDRVIKTVLYFHSKKPEHILQEIFANLTMYNYTELIAASSSTRNATRKLIYKINFSAAANVCR